MSVVRDRFFFALGIVLAVVARGVDGRLGCYESGSGRYYVTDRGTCWVDTMTKRFGVDEKERKYWQCKNWEGTVSCCSVGVGYTTCSLRCIGDGRAFGRACLCALVFNPRCCIPPNLCLLCAE